MQQVMKAEYKQIGLVMVLPEKGSEESPMLIGDWYQEWNVFSKITEPKVFIFESDDNDAEYCERRSIGTNRSSGGTHRLSSSR
jgi:hypothetical protein